MIEFLAQASTQNDVSGSVVDAALICLFPASVIAWILVLRGRLARGTWRPLLPANEGEPPFWGMECVFILIGGVIVLSSFAQAVIGYDNPSRDPLLGMAMSTFSMTGACLLVLGFIWASNPKRIGEVGLRPSWDGIRLGMLAALLIIPPLMLLMAAVSRLIPYEHPVLNLMTAQPTIQRFAVLFVSTAVITPIVEEFSIRVVLQGSLQGFIDRARDDGRRSNWPIVITSFLFAILHFGHGGAPIPLFVLSLALGYLYRQTGNITPSIVVHMALNSLTMIATFLSTNSGASS
ncbi:MAG: type II CAAX endopeptidase family protein [Planctomycetota bacterium]